MYISPVNSHKPVSRFYENQASSSKDRLKYSFPKSESLNNNPLLASINSKRNHFQNLIASLGLTVSQNVERFTSQKPETPFTDNLAKEYVDLRNKEGKFLKKVFDKLEELFPSFFASDFSKHSETLEDIAKKNIAEAVKYEGLAGEARERGDITQAESYTQLAEGCSKVAEQAQEASVQAQRIADKQN